MTSEYTRQMFADSVSANDNDASPVLIAMSDLLQMQEDRHAWLSRAAAQIEAWEQEDAALLALREGLQ